MSLSKRLFLLMCFCIFPYIVYGQRVGLVLSGGGAKGIAHIGLIKALEENNIPIGCIHISEDDSHDLGYCIGKKFWHKGICTEACRAMVGMLRQVGIPYITATHDVNNPRSGNVMQAIGMTYRYSYEELWQPKNVLVTFRMYQLNFDGQQNRVYKKYWDKYPVHFVEEI